MRLMKKLSAVRASDDFKKYDGSNEANRVRSAQCAEGIRQVEIKGWELESNTTKYSEAVLVYVGDKVHNGVGRIACINERHCQRRVYDERREYHESRS